MSRPHPPSAAPSDDPSDEPTGAASATADSQPTTQALGAARGDGESPAAAGSPEGRHAARSEGPRDDIVELPRRVGRLRLERRLGRGGMGDVFEGFDTVLERRVAVKTLRTRRRVDDGSRARFRREARLLSKLEHPRVCRLYDLLEDPDGTAHLILELVPGETLAARSARAPLPVDDALRIGGEVAEALAAAHGRGIVHRDLKPQNVMITPAGEVKVLDFGIARSVEVDDEVTDSTHSGGSLGDLVEQTFRTAAGSIVGTLRWMSPEQARGEDSGPPSDIYSLGILLRELVDGRPAYDTSDTGRLFLRVSLAKTRPLRGVDPHLAALLDDMVRLDPAARPDAETVRRRIDELRDRPRRRRMRRRAAAAAAVVLLLVGLAVWLGRGLPDPPLVAEEGVARVLLLPFDNAAGASYDWVELGLHGLVAEVLDATERIDVVAVDELLRARDARDGERLPRPPAPEAGDWARSFGAELVVGVRLERDGESFVLASETQHVHGSRGRRVFVADSPTRVAAVFAEWLERRLRPTAPRVDLADTFTGDPFVDQVYAVGEQHRSYSRFARAQAYFQVAVDLVPDFHRARRRLAEASASLGQLDEAEAEARRLLDEGDLSMRYAASVVLANIAAERGEKESAREQARASLAMARQLDEPGLVVDALGRLAFESEPAEGLALAREALEIARALDDDWRLAGAEGSLGILHDLQGDPAAALPHLEQALALYRSLRAPSPAHTAWILNSLGVVHRRLGHYEAALEVYDQVEEIHRGTGKTASIALVLLNRADVLLDLDREAEAEDLLHRAYALAQEAQSVRAAAFAASNLVELHARRGEADEVARYLPEVREYFGPVWQVVLSDAVLAAAAGDLPAARRLAAEARATAGDEWTALEDDLVGLWLGSPRGEEGRRRGE